MTGIPAEPGRIFPGKSSKTIAAFLAKGFNNYLNKIGLDQVDISLYRFKHSWAGKASFEETEYGWKFKRQIREYLKQYGFQIDIHKEGGYVTISRREAKKL